MYVHVAAVRGHRQGVGRSLFFLLFDFVRQCSSPWLAFHLFYQKHPTLPPYSETPKHLLAAAAPARPFLDEREQNDSKHAEVRGVRVRATYQFIAIQIELLVS